MTNEIPVHLSTTDALRAFLVETKQSQHNEAVITYAFAINGDVDKAKKFIQAMRVNLTRWKANLSNLQGNTPTDEWQTQFPMFSMNVNEVTPNDELGMTKIVLERQYTDLPKLIMKNGLNLIDLFGA